VWIRACGPINEHLEYLGIPKSGLHLLKGDRYAILGGSGPWSVPDLDRQLQEAHVDLERIRFVYLSHSHYDHCGAVPYLKQIIPGLQVLASDGTKKILEMEKAVRNMRLFTQEALQLAGGVQEVRGYSLEFTPFGVDRVLTDGDLVDLGNGVRLAFFETPGHSRCSMVAYEPRWGWLFPGDSLPFPNEEGTDLVSTASESFVTFCNSLRKLESLKIDLCAWEHHGVRTGEDAHRVISDGIDFTVRYKASVLETLARLGDPERAAEEVSREWVSQTRFPFLPERVMLHICRGIVDNAVKERL
jgi:glyoxylase-like metal-dependent hydrolase (beta-lactamase superfamily II)